MQIYMLRLWADVRQRQARGMKQTVQLQSITLTLARHCWPAEILNVLF